MDIISTIKEGVCELRNILYKRIVDFKNWKWSDEVILVEPQRRNVVTFEILPTNFVLFYINKTQLCKYAEQCGAQSRVIGNKVKFIWPDNEEGEWNATYTRETWYMF